MSIRKQVLPIRKGTSRGTQLVLMCVKLMPMHIVNHPEVMHRIFSGHQVQHPITVAVHLRINGLFAGKSLLYQRTLQDLAIRHITYMLRLILICYRLEASGRIVSIRNNAAPWPRSY